MGKPSRDKGARFEREIVDLFRAHGLKSERVPLSGATWMKDDVLVQPTFENEPWRGECKRRAKLPDYLTAWLGESDFLVMREDRGKAVVVISAERFAELLQ